MNITPTHHNKSYVFFNEEGYVEMVFFGIVNTSELRQLLREMNRLAKLHGPTGFLLDGRYGRIPHNPIALMAFAKATTRSQVTHMVILTNAAHLHRNSAAKQAAEDACKVRANTFGIPQVYLSDEAEARQRAANVGYVAMFYSQNQPGRSGSSMKEQTGPI